MKQILKRYALFVSVITLNCFALKFTILFTKYNIRAIFFNIIGEDEAMIVILIIIIINILIIIINILLIIIIIKIIIILT